MFYSYFLLYFCAMLNVIYLSITVICLFRIFYYSIGEPSNEYNTKSIFSNYVELLSKNRLNKYRLLQEINLQYPKLSECSDEVIIEQIKFDKRKTYLNKAMDLFTYEYVLGICPTCTFFWVSILFILIPSIILLQQPILLCLAIFSLSNIISKFLIKYI